METLTSSAPKIIFGKYRHGCFFSSKELYVNRPQLMFLPSKRHVNGRFLQLVSLKDKTVQAISYIEADSQGELENAAQEYTYQSNTVHVKFQIQKKCRFGEGFFIVGDDPIFGLWNPESAIPMDWSDEHVWSVELDIPVGKSIQFKFILKKATGGILWQPGPDRTIQTWETKNTITIMEDWNDAGYQKIIEEEPMASQNGKPAVQSELIVPDDVIQPEKELVFGIGDAEYQKIIEEEPMASQNGKPAVQSELILPDDFIQPKKELVFGTGDPADAVDSDLDWLSTPEKPVEETPMTDESMVMAKDIRRAATVVEKPESSDDEENLISYEGEPVLVRGLTPLETVSTEGDIQNENQSSVPVDASLGMNEAKNHSLPESDEKQEPESDSHQVKEEQQFEDPHLDKEEQESSMTPLESNSLQNDIKQLNDRHSAKQEQEYNVTPLESNVLQNDIQWGRRTLHMLLNGLGLL